jgi:putative flippase GtrA
MSVALESLMHVNPEQGAMRPAGGEVLMFFVIGACAAASFVVASTALIWVLPMVESWLVSTFCYAACIVPVYLLHRRFSFSSEAPHGQALPRYAAVQIMALALASMFSFLFHGTLALPSLMAAILVIALTSGLNYLVLRNWAFGRDRRLDFKAA